eukprot:3689797-Pleurochrysis_carterae.AAC.1
MLCLNAALQNKTTLTAASHSLFFTVHQYSLKSLRLSAAACERIACAESVLATPTRARRFVLESCCRNAPLASSSSCFRS